MYKRIVIKVGSKVVSGADGLNEAAMQSIVSQIAELRKRNVEVILVTSGATATGKALLKVAAGAHSIAERQVYASVGQVRLMYLYAKLFSSAGLVCGQVLVTKSDFRDKAHYANIKNCFQNLLEQGIVPVVNENDTIAVSELVFSDNDELAGLIASQLNADAVIILSSVEGVLVTEGGLKKTIPEVYADTAAAIEKHIDASISASGRGGMKTKFQIARKLMRSGIVTHILDGRTQNVIVDVVSGIPWGTKFVPGEKLSAVKRRLAHAEGFAVGIVHVNEGAEQMLLKKSGVSVLPVGVTRLEGSFKKGDIVEIRGARGARLGFGIAQYGAEAAAELVGKKGGRALIHTDYLYIG